MIDTGFDRSKSLEELEGERWGGPAFNSRLVIACHQLRRKPLAELTAEDLRLLISQNVGLTYTVPLALELLAVDPLAGGDFYRGDLLKSVLSVSKGFWEEHAQMSQSVEEILLEVESLRDTIDNQILPKAQAFRAARIVN